MEYFYRKFASFLTALNFCEMFWTSDSSSHHNRLLQMLSIVFTLHCSCKGIIKAPQNSEAYLQELIWVPFFRKCEQIHSSLQSCSYLLKEFLTDNFIFCVVKNHEQTNRSSHRRCSIKKAVLKNFAIFTG